MPDIALLAEPEPDIDSLQAHQHSENQPGFTLRQLGQPPNETQKVDCDFTAPGGIQP
jgi:hypothetical protein